MALYSMPERKFFKGKFRHYHPIADDVLFTEQQTSRGSFVPRVVRAGAEMAQFKF